MWAGRGSRGWSDARLARCLGRQTALAAPARPGGTRRRCSPWRSGWEVVGCRCRTRRRTSSGWCLDPDRPRPARTRAHNATTPGSIWTVRHSASYRDRAVPGRAPGQGGEESVDAQRVDGLGGLGQVGVADLDPVPARMGRRRLHRRSPTQVVEPGPPGVLPALVGTRPLQLCRGRIGGGRGRVLGGSGWWGPFHDGPQPGPHPTAAGPW